MDDVTTSYDPRTLDLDRALDGADLVLVHEWNEPALVARIGERRAAGAGFRLLFHDTHHRAASAPDKMARFDLRNYDGVLAFGEVVRGLYLDRGWCERAWTWHEAADTRVFRPPAEQVATRRQLVWIGNWGDGERTEELREFLLEPARRLGLRGTIHGVRYPRRGRWAIRRAGLRYRGWLANHRAPEAFAGHRVTVHVPRRPYVEALPGIPTIRPFEALACAIPLISAPWDDAEELFRAGRDYLVARDGDEMALRLREVLGDAELAADLRRSGLETIAARHTCAHRVDELLEICRELGVAGEVTA
jgi:spore maturation protein CgeB